jgi:hypothetical protein
MKSFLTAAVLLFSYVAFAGPEDRLANQVCYVLEGSLDQSDLADVPKQVCFEEIQLDVMKNKAYIESYFYADLYQNTSLIYLIRSTEDHYKFSTSSLIYDHNDMVCGDTNSLSIVISGQSDFLGAVDKTQVNVAVEHEYTNDNCHSQPHVIKTYKYLLK